MAKLTIGDEAWDRVEGRVFNGADWRAAIDAELAQYEVGAFELTAEELSRLVYLEEHKASHRGALPETEALRRAQRTLRPVAPAVEPAVESWSHEEARRVYARAIEISHELRNGPRPRSWYECISDALNELHPRRPVTPPHPVFEALRDSLDSANARIVELESQLADANARHVEQGEEHSRQDERAQANADRLRARLRAVEARHGAQPAVTPLSEDEDYAMQWAKHYAGDDLSGIKRANPGTLPRVIWGLFHVASRAIEAQLAAQPTDASALRELTNAECEPLCRILWSDVYDYADSEWRETYRSRVRAALASVRAATAAATREPLSEVDERDVANFEFLLDDRSSPPDSVERAVQRLLRKDWPKPAPPTPVDAFTAFECLAEELVEHDRAVQSGAKREGVFNDGRTAAFKIRELVKRVRAEGGGK